MSTLTTSTSRNSSNNKARGAGYGPPVDNVTQLVGNTPMVKLSDKICPTGRTIYAKLEYFNPLSSVKDRLAVAIVEDLERQGKLKPGDTLVEATSGNTGIAIAMVSYVKTSLYNNFDSWTRFAFAWTLVAKEFLLRFYYDV